MKKRTYLYIPLLLLFAITVAAYFQHAYRTSFFLNRSINQSTSIRFPFEVGKNGVSRTLPEAAEGGMQVGDNLVEVNGRKIVNAMTMIEELSRLPVGSTVTMVAERKNEQGEKILVNVSFVGRAMNQTFMQALPDLLVTVVFLLLLPALSYILGFYVAFMRPRDPMAWTLMLLLLGIGSIALEGGTSGSIAKGFQEVMLGTVGIWMVLFGIYFPERSALDRRLPFVKWILIGPLIIVGSLTVGEQFGRFFEIPAIWGPISSITESYDRLFGILTTTAMGAFFAFLGSKSATLENKDSRRRLRILYYGTSVAMLPAFSIVVYRLLSGKTGGFFDLVPGWFALIALVLILLFPFTMAYVIVVERAMDVSVVIRQGLQYALARNGVKVLQFIFLAAIIIGMITIFRSDRFGLLEEIGFVGAGIALIPLIDYFAKNLRVWIDRRFFREAYNAEQILSELSEEVRTMVETRPLLETVSTKISESLHVPQVALLLKKGAAFQPAYSLGYEHMPVTALTDDDVTIGRLRKNETVVIYQDDEDSWVNEDVQAEERDRLKEFNSQLLLPVAAKNVLSGVISLSPKLSEEPYSPTDLRLLKSVAIQTGLALENSRLTEAIATEAAQKERLNRELEIAREVQERLFPQELPAIDGVDYLGACRPALGVGGDYYDFLELPDHKFGIAIGDVSGKGIGASLMMASLQASLRGQAIHCGDDLALLMKHVNTLVYEASTSNRYATFFYAQLELKTRKLTYVNAGHNPPFVLRRQGEGLEVLRLEEGGAVVGMLPTMFVNYTQGEIELQDDDLLIGFTDGISESMNPQEEEWGEDAMLEDLKLIYKKPAAEILPIIVAGADKFANGAKQHDDMTMIVVKITGQV